MNRIRRLKRLLVDPLRIIDETQERPFPREIGQQAKGTEAHQEPIRRPTGEPTERYRNRIGLGRGETVATPDHPGTELMQGGVRQRQLGFHAGDPENRKLRCALSRVFQQRRLADAGHALDHERPTAPARGIADQLVQPGSFRAAPEQHERPPPRVCSDRGYTGL